MRIALSQSAQTSSTGPGPVPSASSVAVEGTQSSSAGSSTQDRQHPSQSQQRDSGGDTAATGAYLASLLAASITGRAPEGARPSKITPERLSMLIAYLESSVASTAPERSEEHAVDVKG